MTTECTACTAPADLYLCPTCQLALKQDLRDTAGHQPDAHGGHLPSLVAELHTTLTRQHRITTGDQGRPSADTPLPYHPRAADDLRNLNRTITLWTDQVATRRHLHPPDTAQTEQLAAWLYGHAHDLAQLDDADQALTQIRHATAAARDTINRPPDRRYIGPCDTCGADLYVPALGHHTPTVVRCRNPVEQDGRTVPCGAQYPMSERRAWLLEQAYDRLLTAAEMSRAIRELIPGQQITPNRISQWAARGRLQKFLPHPRDPHHKPRFRVEDVIHVARDTERHTTEKKTA